MLALSCASLGLKSYSRMAAYYKSGKKPADIPAIPNQFMRMTGWAGMGDWLGTGTVATPTPISTLQEGPRVRAGLGLKSVDEWQAYCRSGKKPADIPANPDGTYAKAGWAGIGDWLGTGTVAPGQYRPFKKARAFVRGLGLKSWAEWLDYVSQARNPTTFRLIPHKAYAKDGWVGHGDWLGTGTVAPVSANIDLSRRPGHLCAAWNLKSENTNGVITASRARSPTTFRLDRTRCTAKLGGSGWGDWLGTGRVPAAASWRSFKKARAFARALGLKSSKNG